MSEYDAGLRRMGTDCIDIDDLHRDCHGIGVVPYSPIARGVHSAASTHETAAERQRRGQSRQMPPTAHNPTMNVAALLLAIATSAHAGYACVDPADATARRWFQDEPCQLPMFHRPRPGNPTIAEPPRWGTFQGGEAAAQAGHAFFWRFPVQGNGPQGAPSVGPWRSWR